MKDELLDSNSPSQWGLRIATGEYRWSYRTVSSGGCPAWANPSQQKDWRTKDLIVWNNATHQLVALRAWEVLALLQRLRSTQAWKTIGDRITRHVTRLTLNEPKAKSKARKTK